MAESSVFVTMIVYLAVGTLLMGGFLALMFYRIRQQASQTVHGCEVAVKRLASRALATLKGTPEDSAIIHLREIPAGFEFFYAIEPTTDQSFRHRFQIIQTQLDTRGNLSLLAAVSENALLKQLTDTGINLQDVEWDASERFALHPAISFILEEKDQRLFQQWYETRTSEA